MGKSERPSRSPRRHIGGPILLLAACTFGWAALVTFDPGDWPSPHQYPHRQPAHNACGPAGAWIAYQLSYCLGSGSFALLTVLTLGAGQFLARGHLERLAQRGFGLALLVACVAAIAHLLTGPGGAPIPEGRGGLVGFALGDFLHGAVGSLGAALILTYGTIVGVLFAAEGWVVWVPGLIRRIGEFSGGGLVLLRRAGMLVNAPAASVAHSAAPVGTADRAERTRPEPRINTRRPRRKFAGPDADQPDLFDGDEDAQDQEEAAGSEVSSRRRRGAAIGARIGDDDDPARRKTAVVHVARPRAEDDEPSLPYPTEIEDWKFPPLSLLHDAEYTFTAQQESRVRDKAKVLERTLEEFRIDAQVVEIETGPVITMYELQVGAGVKVSQISSLTTDIARALRSPAVRVVSPIPGKNTVGIEVPNIDKENVRLKELISLCRPRAAHMSLPLFLGKDASGDGLVVDLATMPHLLIAGTTGSGKSVCINSIITSLLMTTKPDRVKMILVDPKMVELSQFKAIPHLMSPIVTDVARAEAILEWAVTKMDERYELLAEAGVRNITAFNALGREGVFDRLQPTTDDERAQIPTHLAYIVIIIDELADLMMTAAKEVEHHLSRLAQKSRAVGVHIIVATQRPEARVVTGLIKSNLPCRIAFRVSSRMDSRIVLDQNGAEVLLGQGDMLFLPPGSAKLIRVQGTFVDDGEMRAVLDFLAEAGPPQFHPQLMRLRTAGGNSSGERDALFDDAVGVVLETKRGSVSLLQRRLTIGYSRASRLIDQMADGGIVGGYKGSQAREVLMTPDQWDALRAQVRAEEAAEAEEEAARADVRGPAEDDGPDDEVPALIDDHDIED